MSEREAFNLLLETCEVDSRSAAFDPELRERIGRAVCIIMDRIEDIESVLSDKDIEGSPE